jgi:hypothetical protein
MPAHAVNKNMRPFHDKFSATLFSVGQRGTLMADQAQTTCTFTLTTPQF